MNHVDVVILGGGISGLAAARQLQDSKADYLLLEKSPSLGGLTRTVQVGDFCFDYTGHFLHLRHYASPSHIPFAALEDADWVSVERRSACYVMGKMVTAPIQYHLGELPLNLLDSCVKSYNERPRLDASAGNNFREYLVTNFGEALADLFLVPQNEKTFAISLDRLSTNAVKRFFPAADDAAIQRGIHGEKNVAGAYNSSFWYPKTGGIETLVRGFAEGLERVVVNQEVCAIDLKLHKLRTNTGWEISWDKLLSSVPLPTFCRATGEPELLGAASQLTHSATVSVNIGVRGEVATPLQGRHWVYIPDRAVPFYRVGVYSNISQGLCSPGHSAIYAEVGVPGERLGSGNILGIQESVVEGLAGLGWLDRGKVECVVSHIMSCAYVHHTPAAATLVEKIVNHLGQEEVFPIGRYGRWDYTSMEDSIEDGLSTARTIVA